MSTKTSALVLQAIDAPFSLEEITLAPLQADELLVEMVASGVCHTDLAVQHGHLPVGGYPIVIGHEGAGIVKEVGTNVSHVRPGDKVLLSFASCGECRTCRAHHPSYCATFHIINFGSRRPDGTFSASNDKGDVFSGFFGQSSFAKTSVVHKTSAVPIKDVTDEDLRQLAPLGCGLMTGAGTVWNICKAEKGRAIAIFGAGGVGFGAIFAAKTTGLNPIIAVDLDEGRLTLAKELGATHVINAKVEKDVVGRIREITDGWGVDYCVETTANERGEKQALECVGKMSKLAVVGTALGRSINATTEMLVQTGVQIIGVAMGDADTQEFIPKLVQEYKAGRFPLDRVTKFYKPEDVNKATQDMLSGAVIKPILVWR